MEPFGNAPKLNIPSLIQQMQVKPLEKFIQKPFKFFPYIETYGRHSKLEENQLMNQTIKFRESYMHGRTLRYMEPTFSCNQVLTNLKLELRVPKPRKMEKLKVFRESSNLRDIINRTELYINREIAISPKPVRHRKAKSQFPNGITKVQKFRLPSKNYERITPDLLRVTNLAFSETRSKYSRKHPETLTFYREMPITQDTYVSDYNIQAKYNPQIAERKTGKISLRNTCDAVSNTELLP